MKIALYHNLTSGGSKREVFEFARQFVRDGHTVHVYCPSTADESFLPLSQVAQQTREFKLHLVPEFPGRLPFLRRYVDLVGWAENLRRMQRVARETAGEIDASGYDFVFVHHDRVIQAPYVLRHMRTPSVYYCNEPMREFYDPPITRPYFKARGLVDRAQQKWYAPARRIRRTVTRSQDHHNLTDATLLLTNSYFTAESIYRAHGVRARVSYLGVNEANFRPLGLERQNFVLSVGAVSPLKGYDFLIEALALLPIGRRPRLVIVGNTASAGEMVYLRGLASSCAVQMEICVDVSDDELVLLYNQARALVYSPVLEPFGLAPLEAMACGTPVVAVMEGGVRESVLDGETGRLVPRDPSAFAGALQRVLDDQRYAASLGENGQREVLRFWTWEQAYRRLHDNVKAFEPPRV